MKPVIMNVIGTLLIVDFFGALFGLILVLVRGALGYEHDLNAWFIQWLSLFLLVVIFTALNMWFAMKWEEE